MPTYSLGQVAIVNKGAWSSGTAYVRLNTVTHNGGSFMAIASSTNKEPGVASGWGSYWVAMSKGIKTIDIVADSTTTAHAVITLSDGTSVTGSIFNTSDVPDGSITTAKLGSKVVTAAKIADKTITAAQIADTTITAAKMASGVIPSAASVAPQAPATNAAVGSSAKYAREDHVHPLQTVPEAATANPQAAGTANKGSSTKYAREDHVHPAQTVPSPYTSNPAALGTASAGNSANYARGNHVHPLPSLTTLGIKIGTATPTTSTISNGQLYFKHS